MLSKEKSTSTEMHLPDPIFPPLLTGHSVKAPARPMVVAVDGAMTTEFGAGDIVWARDTARLECAIVLEPEIDRQDCPEMLFLAMVAFGDAIGALAPPEVGVRYRWPRTITINGAVAGQAHLVMASETDDDGAPRFLVVGVDMAIHSPRDRIDPGHEPDRTTLIDECGSDIDRTELLESYARHFLAWIDTWETDGFGTVHDMWLGRAERDGTGNEIAIEAGSVDTSGKVVGLDDHGNLLLRRGDGIVVIETMDALLDDAAGQMGMP